MGTRLASPKVAYSEWLHRRCLVWASRIRIRYFVLRRLIFALFLKNGGRERSDRSSTSVARRTLLHVFRTVLHRLYDERSEEERGCTESCKTMAYQEDGFRMVIKQRRKDWLQGDDTSSKFWTEGSKLRMASPKVTKSFYNTFRRAKRGGKDCTDLC